MITESVLFALLRSEVCGVPVRDAVKDALSMEMIEGLYKLSHGHDLAHIVGQALSKLGVLGSDETSKKLKTLAVQAAFRYVGLNREYLRICACLEKAKIPFVPLKGSVIRDWYPEPWMRTSCDIDVLVHEEDLEQAVAALVAELGYKSEGRGYHDVSLFSPSNIHLELHYTLTEKDSYPAAQAIVADVWQDVTPVKENSMQMQMSDEMFYFYHILHMVNHMCNGGCGIRSFLDIWIMQHRKEHDVSSREMLLKKGGLLTFAQAAQALSEVWLSEQQHTPLTRQLETFILCGGVYGTAENMAAVQRAKKGGKLKTILAKIFLPYGMLKSHYPILQRHKWMYPLCTVARWFRLLSGARWKRSADEMKAYMSVSEEETKTAAELLQNLGL